MATSGIYLIVNLANNKIYVGSAIDTDDRWRLHKLELNRDNHHNRHLQSAWNLYGETGFKFYVIEFVAHNLEEREQYWIDHLNATNHSIGYNICKAGRNRSGVKASEETRKKLSESHKGYKQSKETKEKRRLKMIGNQFNKGRKQTEAHKAAIIASRKGYVPSAETREKIRLSNLNQKRSEEAKRKMSIAAKKRWNSLDNTENVGNT
jgi:group I intron endonuclease